VTPPELTSEQDVVWAAIDTVGVDRVMVGSDCS
jgi:hypothetical protein